MSADYYHEIRQQLMVFLTGDARLHNLERYELLGIGFIATAKDVQDVDDPRYAKLRLAIRFWEAWLAARDSSWLHNEGIALDAWSTLATRIVDDLKHDRDISDKYVRSCFDLTATQPYLRLAASNSPAADSIPPCRLAS